MYIFNADDPRGETPDEIFVKEEPSVNSRIVLSFVCRVAARLDLLFRAKTSGNSRLVER